MERREPGIPFAVEWQVTSCVADIRIRNIDLK